MRFESLPEIVYIGPAREGQVLVARGHNISVIESQSKDDLKLEELKAFQKALMRQVNIVDELIDAKRQQIADRRKTKS